MSYVRDFVSLFSPPTLRALLFAVWLLSFVILPIARAIWGARGEIAGTTAGVIATFLVVTAFLVPTHGWWTLAVVIGVPALGWLSEFVGSRTGLPFGAYHYTDRLRPQIGGVPVIIPLAWLMMMPSSWAVGSLLAPGHPVVQWAIAAAAFTAWDLFVDPQMVTQGYWVWDRPGVYVGIPLVNFLGWFAVAFVITAAFEGLARLASVDLVRSIHAAPFLALFVATWVLQSVGHLLFWRLRVSAAVGFAGMGVFVVLAAVAAFGS